VLRGKPKCGACGAVLHGVVHGNLRHYQHPTRTRRNSDCISTINAEVLEFNVFRSLGQTFASRKALDKAITLGLDDTGKRRASIEEQLADLSHERTKLKAKQARFIELAASMERGNTQQTVQQQAREIDSEFERIDALERELRDALGVASRSSEYQHRASELIECLKGGWGTNIMRWSTEHKRALLDILFGDGTTSRKSQGIYVQKYTRDGKLCEYEVDIRLAVQLDEAAQRIAAAIQPTVLGRPRLRNVAFRTHVHGGGGINPSKVGL